MQKLPYPTPYNIIYQTENYQYIPECYKPEKLYFDEEYVFNVEYDYLDLSTGEIIIADLLVYHDSSLSALNLAEWFLFEHYEVYVIRSVYPLGKCKKPGRGTKRIISKD